MRSIPDKYVIKHFNDIKVKTNSPMSQYLLFIYIIDSHKE